MAVYTEPGETENVALVMALSDAEDNNAAIREIDGWARKHGFVRSAEYHLGRKQTADGRMLFFSPCYRLDEEMKRAADTDLTRMRLRREAMPQTTSSDVLLRAETEAR